MKNSNQTQFQKEESRQFMWEMWFISSAVIFLSFFLVATMEGSKDAFPNLPIFATISLFNLAICVYKGCKPRN